MIFSQRELDVDGGEQGEHVRLKYGDEDFKKREHKAEGKGSDSKKLEERGGLEDEPRCRTEAQHQKKVTSDHVHEESKREGNRTQDKDREELDGRHDDVNRPGDSGREEGVLEERSRVLSQTRVNEGHVSDYGHHDGQTHKRGSGDVQTGNDSGKVHRQRRKEDGGQQRQEALAVFLAQEVFGNVDANEVEGHFDQRLAAAGNNLHATRAQPEEQDQHGCHEQANQNDSVDLKRGADKKEEGREKLINRRSDKGTVAATLGKQVYSVL